MLKFLILTWSKMTNFKFVFILFVIMAVAASAQLVLRGEKQFEPNGKTYTHYNNYVIFKQAHLNLLQSSDLYAHYPDKQWDLYKYSPAFALFFGVFAYLPDFAGLILWNLLNALCLFFAFKLLPGINHKTKVTALLIVAIEMLTSLQSSQSNGLLSGLIILSFALLERQKYLWATLFIVVTFYIKIYGVLAFVLCLFYPKKTKIALYSTMWMVFFAILPIVVTPFAVLKMQYLSWWQLLINDHETSYGLSVFGWLHSWFHLNFSKNIVLLLGLLILMLPYVNRKKFTEYSFRLLNLASLLIWLIIFNHKAESSTFIIALSGIAIGYLVIQKSSTTNTLLVLALILTSLSPSDLFPPYVRNNIMMPYAVKAVPCIMVWFYVIYVLLTEKYKTEASIMESKI